MKNLSLLFIAFLLIQLNVIAQRTTTEQSHEPVFFKVTSHDSNITELPEKSFYESKSDWQYIIDTTWGPGLPLAEKQQIFNAYATSIREQFDGFESLQMNENSWDSLRAHYYSMIDDSTSKGGFSAIMSHFSMQLKDVHTGAYDESVVLTPLNPGIPVLVISAFSTSIQHFGAVVTALPDSSLLVLRTVANHPLDLQPGDILLGYEGVPWKILVKELIDAGLPTIGRWGGAKSAHSDALLLGAGMNWHLFESIDILKHSTGDTLHLSVYPLLNLPPENMLNNEQLSVPGVPFPNLYNQQYVSYGVIDGTNIGYIYLCAEVQGTSDQQFYEAVTALEETDALIIDMRLNFGGWAFFNNSLEILFNESHLTIEDAYRCNINDFTLCPSGNSPTFKVPGNPPAFYDRPIAIFLGPTCVSMGDVTAQRFRYHPTVRFFGKSSAASLGDNVGIVNFPNWKINYSISDMFHVNEPGEYLNRTEFPIDYPVWFNPEDVANGYDTVVEEALEWINNLVYGHGLFTNTGYAQPGVDTISVSATIENPNAHNVTAKVFVKDLNNTLIDSLQLYEIESGSLWQGGWLASNYEDIFKLDIKCADQTTGESFTIKNVNRIATAGPVTLDSVYVFEGTGNFSITPFLKNQSADSTIKNTSVRLICNDPWIISINPNSRGLPNIPPGVMVYPSAPFTVTVDTLTFPGYFNFKVDVLSDGWVYWTDSMRVPPTAIISIDPSVLDFGEVAIDSSATKTFTITNYGNEDLMISNITSSEPAFTVNITNAVVPPDSSEDVEVTFTPTGSISFNGKIEITHNAAGSPDSVIVTGDGVTGIKDELLNTIPTEFIVYQNYPNPFNPTTTIKYGLKEKSFVELTICDILGSELSLLVNEEQDAGYYKVDFNAAKLASGIYLYQLKAGNFVETKKMILLK